VAQNSDEGVQLNALIWHPGLIFARTYASDGFLTLLWSFFRPAGRKNDLQEKESTMLPQAILAFA
jgi:hypothetical protein